MYADQTQRSAGLRRSKTAFALCGFIAIAALLMILEHRAHALQWLPFALLLACPLLHLFHGHGGHGGAARDENGRESGPDPDGRA